MHPLPLHLKPQMILHPRFISLPFRPLKLLNFRLRSTRQFSSHSLQQKTKPDISTEHSVTFSGIQPTGVPHLGNYLGALKQWAKAQNETTKTPKQIYCIVDLHALTQHHNPEILRQWKRETLAMLLSIGLREDAIVFEQSQVPAHSEMMWILSCITSTGALERMTQWKTKLNAKESESEKDFPSLKLGLFSYPVLQAADILVHRASYVPVGEDQSQHLEITRQLAASFNHVYGAIFPIPQTVLSPAKRIMSLRDPTKKMSKSHGDEKSRILLTDSPEVIHEKLTAAVTDSFNYVGYDTKQRPGVSNLLEIYAHMEGKEGDMSAVVEEFKDILYKDFKHKVGESIANGLKPIRAKYEEIMKEGSAYLDEVCRKGAKMANESAEETLQLVRKAVGLR